MNPEELGAILKSQGKHMGRQKRQRPTVYLWKSKSGEKYWKCEWRCYIEGRPKPKHRAHTWPCKDYTKTEAQKECDRLVAEETEGPIRADGSMLVREFWDKVYWPTTKLRISKNTEISYESNYRLHVAPALGGIELQRVSKAAIDGVLNKMAAAGSAKGTIDVVRSVIHAIFIEAQEEGYISRNPARRSTVPLRAKEKKQTRALTEAEVKRIFDLPVDRMTLMFRVMLMTGARIGEVLALTKDDLLPGGLLIDESALAGRASTTKNRKIRRAPLPPELRAELEAWAKQQPGNLLFPSVRGGLGTRNSILFRDALAKIRKDAKIPDLTPRMCRTTFATLYVSDPADVQSILGHHSEQFTLEHYRRPISDRQQAAADELEARVRGKVVTMKDKRRAG